MMYDPRYPIGKYQSQPYSEEKRREWLDDIRYLPGLVENAVNNLDADQLNTPYRDGGWTVQQVVHHIADSHMNAYCRLKLGLTEENPTIKPYDEKGWANLPDTENVPVNVSITLLHALHMRWHEIVKNIAGDDWDRTVYHPGSDKNMSMWYLLGLYSWHGHHHVQHIMKLRESKGWIS